MIADFETTAATRFEADLCIIGAGLAGITLALEFDAQGRRVLLVESGGHRPDPATQSLYDAEVTGLPHHGVHDGRARTYGGTSTLWGGQALPLFPIDFQRRPWVSHSGWPIAATDLASYYQRAAQVLGVRGAPYDASAGPKLGIQPPPFDPHELGIVFSQWSPQPNFAFAYHDKLARSDNVQVLMHANVVSVVPASARGAIRMVRIKTLGGKIGEVRARHFVLCTGGLETARLLLASDEVDPAGVGNASGTVGRFFQDHVAVNCGAVVPQDRRAFQDIFDQSYRGGIKHLPKLVYGEAAQRAERALNVIGNVVFVTPQDAAVMHAKRLYGALRRRQRPEQLRSALLSFARDTGELGRLLYRYRVQRRSYSPKVGPIYLEAHLEQEPDPDSRLSLAQSRDALGMRRARLSWRVGRSSWHSAGVFAQAVKTEFERLKLARVEVALNPQAAALPWEVLPADLNHHMGTTRMNADRELGVVDSDCRVHDADNLHIASSAVFPTSGSSNPSLTVLALTLRLADRLKALL